MYSEHCTSKSVKSLFLLSSQFCRAKKNLTHLQSFALNGSREPWCFAQTQFHKANEMIGRCGLTRQAECIVIPEHCRGGNEFKGSFECEINYSPRLGSTSNAKSIPQHPCTYSKYPCAPIIAALSVVYTAFG